MPRVDFDRGAILRLHPSGARICAYVDSPGTYFDMNEQAVPDSIAVEAGFNVEIDRRERRKTEALDKARADIEREFAAKDGDYAKAMDAAMLGPMEVKHMGGGRFALFDFEGKRVTEGKLTREQADKLIEMVSQVSQGEAEGDDKAA